MTDTVIVVAAMVAVCAAPVAFLTAVDWLHRRLSR